MVGDNGVGFVITRGFSLGSPDDFFVISVDCNDIIFNDLALGYCVVQIIEPVIGIRAWTLLGVYFGMLLWSEDGFQKDWPTVHS